MSDIFGSLAPSLSDPEYWRRLGGIIGNTADPFGSQPFGMTGYGGGRAPLKPAKRSPIDPTQTGWTFKDYKPVHSEMGKGDWARANQDNAVEVELPIRSLFASQKTVNPDFASVPDRDVYKGGDKTHPFVIKKNGQFFVQDGHHRLIAAAQSGKQTAKVRMVDLDGTTQTDFPLLDQAPTPVFGSMAPKPVGITAYHGSPHDFDRFSMDKIGAGEGAQAYGHGLYFAQNEGVAKQYRDDLTAMRVGKAQRAMDNAGGDVDAAIAQIKSKITNLKGLPNAGNDPERQARFIQYNEETLAELNAVRRGEPLTKGRMYEVNINANEDDFLDWDKPLSEQSPKVQQAIAAHPQAKQLEGNDMVRGQLTAPTGENIYRRLSAESYPIRADANSPWGPGGSTYEESLAMVGGDKSRVNRLLSGLPENKTDEFRKAGIPGIKYLDAGSRSEGNGSRNFVVFDDRIINIVKKYGIGAALAAGFITQEQADDIEAQRGSGRI